MNNEISNPFFKETYKENLGLTVYKCGFQKCNSAHCWGPAIRDHYLVHFITAGKGRFSNGSFNYELSAGDMFLAVPSKTVSYCADEDEPWEYYWVGFNGTDAEALTRMAGLSEVNPVMHYEDGERIKNAILNIYNAKGASFKNEAKMTGYLYILFSLLMELSDMDGDTMSDGFEYIEKSLKYIQHNYSHEIKMDELAAIAGLSRSHLYRMFIKYLSMPPNEFISRFRINQACMLLREHHFPISKAAYSCGFNDQLYFSRIFKKYIGIPPSAYLKQHQNKKSHVE